MVRESGLASSIHADPMAYLKERTARIIQITKPALVLGSNQDPEVVNRPFLDDLGAELVVRRSGGGAVFLEPSAQLWVDLAIPKDDRLFMSDVVKSFFPIGELFLQVFSKVGDLGLEMHTGNLVGGAIAKSLCFAGVGPGEITYEGAKLLGISQRRSALGAVFQCTVYSRFPVQQMHNLLLREKLYPVEIPLRGYALGVSEVFGGLYGLPDAEVISLVEQKFVEVIGSQDF